MKYWYAVLTDNEDSDWGNGSYNLREAKKMARKYEEGQIAVIDENKGDPMCGLVLKRDDFWMGKYEIDQKFMI